MIYPCLEMQVYCFCVEIFHSSFGLMKYPYTKTIHLHLQTRIHHSLVLVILLVHRVQLYKELWLIDPFECLSYLVAGDTTIFFCQHWQSNMGPLLELFHNFLAVHHINLIIIIHMIWMWHDTQPAHVLVEWWFAGWHGCPHDW